MALTGITAIWAIEDTAQLRAGETILIQGGAGGVAGFAIQLAKYLGATVVTTTSAANFDYVRTLGGADSVVDYNADAGAVSPPPIARYDLADAAEAHRLSEVVACGVSWFSPFADLSVSRPSNAWQRMEP